METAPQTLPEGGQPPEYYGHGSRQQQQREEPEDAQAGVAVYRGTDYRRAYAQYRGDVKPEPAFQGVPYTGKTGRGVHEPHRPFFAGAGRRRRYGSGAPLSALTSIPRTGLGVKRGARRAPRERYRRDI